MSPRKFFIFTLPVLLVMLMVGCKSNPPAPGKWMSYQERELQEERNLLKSLQVASREMYAPHPEDTMAGPYLAGKIYYDEWGQDTLELNLLPDGSILKQIRKTYRDSLLLSMEMREANGYNNRSELSYDEKGNRVHELMFKRGDSLLKRSYQFDAFGNELHVDLHTFRDKSNLTLDTERDKLGRPVLVKEAKQNGDLNWTESYQMSDTLWTIIRKDGAGQLTSKFELKFGPNGKLKSMKNLDENGRIRMHVSYERDEKGRMIREESWSPQGISTQYTEFEYDDRGLLVERRFYTPQLAQPIISKFKYNFR